MYANRGNNPHQIANYIKSRTIANNTIVQKQTYQQHYSDKQASPTTLWLYKYNDG